MPQVQRHSSNRMTPTKLWRKPIDFFARREHFIDHMLPVWNALKGNRGRFHIPEYLREYAEMRGVEDAVFLKPLNSSVINVVPDGLTPLLVSAYGDMVIAHRRTPQRPFLMMEHGVGLTFNGCPGYAGGTGMRQRVAMFLAPNEYIRAKTAKALPGTPQVVIGTPKLDWLASAKFPPQGRKPVVAIGFHWNGEKVANEAGNAFLHFKDFVPELARQSEFTLLGHGHPKYRFVLEPFYESLGIEMDWDFTSVMRRADLYVNDCSSTMYEFSATGKPVVIMNAPWFRRGVKHGIRFWDYTDIGPQVEGPEELLDAIRLMLGFLPSRQGELFVYHAARKKMTDEPYPHIGHSAERAAGAILGFLGGKHG